MARILIVFGTTHGHTAKNRFASERDTPRARSRGDCGQCGGPPADSLMVLPALLVGAEAIRSNVLERRALTALGESMARTRTYAELETAMFDQTELIWRDLSGLDPTARKEFQLTGEVVDYWQDRWRAELKPEEATLADGVQGIQRQIVAVSESVFALEDAGRREDAYRLAERELRGRLQPALTQMNREIYRRARESSVRGAFGRLEEILADEGRTLVAIIALALVAGLAGELGHLAEPGPPGQAAHPGDGRCRRRRPRPPDPGHARGTRSATWRARSRP